MHSQIPYLLVSRLVLGDSFKAVAENLIYDFT